MAQDPYAPYSAPKGQDYDSTLPLDARTAAAQELQRKNKLRDQGVAAGYAAGNAGLAEGQQLQQAGAQGLTAMDQATQQGQLAMRRNAAQGLAAGQAAGGSGNGGGGAYAAALQAGQTGGQNEAQYGAQQAQARNQMQMGNIQAVGQAQTQGYGQLAEAAKAAGAAGSQYTDRQTKVAALDKQVADIGVQYNHWYGNDNPRAAAAIRALVSNEEDQEVKDKYLRIASDIQNGNWGIAK